ncbi:MAG: GAF domain-containing protein [Pseudolabrys sp.]
MRQRGKSKQAERGRQKPKPKGSTPPKGLQEQVAALAQELKEAREQQSATAEVLKVISSSQGDLEPVFQAMLENAVRICDASFGMLFRFDAGLVSAEAMVGVPPQFAEFWRRGPQRPGPRTAFACMIEEKRTVHITDVRTEPAYVEGEPVFVAAVNLAGFRTLLTVPMLKENELIGAFAIYRQEVRPFTDNQIDLLTNFAAQAVIAIENTRLLSELRESLQQQTATADVLRVISSSPGELKPVFNAILENAVRLCDAKFGHLWLREGEALRMGGTHGAPDPFVAYLREVPIFRPKPETGLGQLLRMKQLFHLADIAALPTYGDKLREATIKLAGARSLIGVPMIKDDEVIGAIVIYRQEVRPFNDKQIALVQNFAAQAVIAIENTRLLNELRESLQQQTATADVLKVISSSPGDMKPVFEAMLTNALRICEAKFGHLLLYDGDRFHAAHLHDVPAAYREYWQKHGPIRPGPNTGLGRIVRDKQMFHIPDLKAEAAYAARDSLRVVTVEQAGARSLVGVPMLKEGNLVGAIVIYRQEVRPFTERQIELLKNFAAQAVIAIENTRLLNELRQRTDDLTESLEQQTATSEVLRIISSSPGDLEPVFEAMLQNSVRICEAGFGQMFLCEGDNVRLVAAVGVPTVLVEFDKQRGTFQPSPGGGLDGVMRTKQVVHIADLLSEHASYPPTRLGGARSYIAVPMLKENKLVGAIAIYRQEVRPFTDKQIDLVKNFAAQAVIAIENTRLLNELRQRTTDLSKSLEELRTTQDRLVQTQKLALLGQLTAGIAHEIKNPLNFVNNFSGISAELIGELQDTLKGMPLGDKARTEINELTDTLKSNFDKVVHHGRRADAIVKNMLQHSREGSGEHRVIDINALVEESLNLAWHGARAETQGFEVKLKQSFDPSAGGADVFPQDIRRALLNLIANGFYAATRRRAETNGGDYEPTLTASTKNLGDRVEVRIRDNGTGMTPNVKEKMFEPFFTTKPTGEGTGLGLSISHDIIVKQHAGSIEVDTTPGEFTEIRIVLPRTPAFV